jgi:phosphoglycolate phosphatase
VNRCVIFFDIDGTLLSTGGAGQSAMERALVEDFRIPSPFEDVQTAGRTDRGIADEIFERYGLKDTDDERLRFRESYLDRLPESLAELQGALLPGVIPLLELLAGRKDVVLSLLTGNYAMGARIKLQHFRIDSFFESGGFGDAHASRDDVARLAAATIRDHLNLKHDPKRMIVIGDTPADVQCARAIDATAVAVATGRFSADELERHAPDHLFGDLSQPEQFVDQVLNCIP